MFLTWSTGRILQACYDLYNLLQGKLDSGIFYYPFGLFIMETDVQIESSFGLFLYIWLELVRIHLAHVLTFGKVLQKSSVTSNQLLLRSNQLLISIIMHI